MPRKRNYKSEYVKRQEIARAKGYKSYYDYRIHRHGKLSPETPVPSRLRRRRGGRRGIGQAFKAIEDDRVELFTINVSKRGTKRKPSEFDIQLTLDDGSTEEYHITDPEDWELMRDLVADHLEPEQLVGSPSALAEF